MAARRVLCTRASLSFGDNRKGDEAMKKHTRVILVVAGCLAGFMGQLAAFGANTNSLWNVTSISLLSAGKTKIVETNAVSALFLSDGTCSFLVGTNTYAGTYTNNTKQVTVTLSAGGLAGLESNAADFAISQVPPQVTIKIKSIKFTSKIPLKNGIPSKAGDTVSGTGSETVSGKTKSKSFSVKTALTDWVLSAGAIF